jgi:hypothetical protein
MLPHLLAFDTIDLAEELTLPEDFIVAQCIEGLQGEGAAKLQLIGYLDGVQAAHPATEELVALLKLAVFESNPASMDASALTTAQRAVWDEIVHGMESQSE